MSRGRRAIQSEKKKFACIFFLPLISTRIVFEKKKEWKTRLVQDSRLWHGGVGDCFSIRNLSYYFSDSFTTHISFSVFFCVCAAHCIEFWMLELKVRCMHLDGIRSESLWVGENRALLSWTCLNWIWNWFRGEDGTGALHETQIFRDSKNYFKLHVRKNRIKRVLPFLSHSEYFLNWKNIVNASLKSIGEE